MSSSPLLPAAEREESSEDLMTSTRQQTRRFLTSKTAHYSILLLVSLDVACLFADLVINLFTCGHRTPHYDTALKVLEYVSLTFSCLFVLELLASLWAFGLAYFHSKFHCLDALVIVASFVFEVALQGIEEEVASLIVILRLMRIVKIVDELSVGAEEQMKDLEDRLTASEKENEGLRNELQQYRNRFPPNDSADGSQGLL